MTSQSRFLEVVTMAINNLNSRLSRSVRVRIAQPEDAERVTTVINSAFRRAEGFFVDGDRIDVGSVLNFLHSGNFLLAESEGTLLGCVYVEPPPGVDGDRSSAHSPDRAYLGLLAVDPAHQQSGLGSVLMDAAEDYCRGLGAGFMNIKVVNHRAELLPYYRRRGYVEIGTSPFPADVETKVSCHFIDMTKPLRPGPVTQSEQL
jgi:GNAT superfamily N-acetyltransferase